MTGVVPCTYRATANYRTQYGSLSKPAPFTTFSASYDAILFKDRTNGGGLGLGFLAYNDGGGTSGYQNLTAMFSTAYHQRLGSNSLFSFGVQAGVTQKSLDYTKLEFEDMVQFNGFNGVSSELIPNESFAYFDLHAGVLYQVKFSEGFGLYAGGAYYHIPQPTESFLGLPNTINPRLATHAGLRIGINNQFLLIPAVLVQSQGGASEMVAGSKVGFRVGEVTTKNPTFVYFGAYVRTDESVVSMASIDFRQFQFGISYDVTATGLLDKSITTGDSGGSIELTFTYNGCIEIIRDIIDCPKF